MIHIKFVCKINRYKVNNDLEKCLFLNGLHVNKEVSNMVMVITLEMKLVNNFHSLVWYYIPMLLQKVSLTHDSL